MIRSGNRFLYIGIDLRESVKSKSRARIAVGERGSFFPTAELGIGLGLQARPWPMALWGYEISSIVVGPRQLLERGVASDCLSAAAPSWPNDDEIACDDVAVHITASEVHCKLHYI